MVTMFDYNYSPGNCTFWVIISLFSSRLHFMASFGGCLKSLVFKQSVDGTLWHIYLVLAITLYLIGISSSV